VTEETMMAKRQEHRWMLSSLQASVEVMEFHSIQAY